MRRLLLCFSAGLLALPLLTLLPASASHDDGSYDIPVWFEWGESTLDVLIVPPAHGQIVNGNGALNGGDPSEATPFNSYLAAIEDSIAEWDKAVDMFGPGWLQSGLVTNVYVIGRDQVPDSALRDPEIVVISDETKGPILGVAFSTRPCIVDNSKFFVTSFTYEDMYNVSAHEYGHCLGLDHVVDAHPAHDVMAGTYADPVGAKGTHLHCVSNLDVKGLEAAFGKLFSQPAPSVASLPVAQYGTTCEPPSGVTPQQDSTPTARPSPSSSASPTSGPTTTPSPSTSPSPTSSTEPTSGPSPSSSPTPEPTASEDPSDPPSHEQGLRTIKLRLRRHLIATGRVTAVDGSTRCEEGVRVAILKRRASRWRLVKMTTTTATGAFRVRVPDRTGAYRAEVSSNEECSAATSRRIRHRHS